MKNTTNAAPMTNAEINAAARAEIAANRAKNASVTLAQLQAMAAQRAAALKDAERAYGRALGMGTVDEVRAAGARINALRNGG